MARAALLLLLLSAALAASALENGLARTPPMGWRSWNCYLLDVSQEKMLSVAKAMSSPVGGKPPLSSVGFVRVGIDDGWQECDNHNFHDKNGNPVVNTTRFPDLKAFSEDLHKMGLLSGWYGNNCWCNEQGHPPHYTQDANAAAGYLFDGIKIDGCGPAHNITEWVAALNATGRPMLLENCGDNHASWSPPLPSELETCGFNLYRISNDIAPQFYSTMYNLQRQVAFQDETNPMSRPGCWSYPDMLQVANQLNYTESRTHFAAWAVTSAPLILGFDVTDSALMEMAYDIITNKDVIAVNQAWAGHPGRLVANSSSTFQTQAAHGASGHSFTTEVFPDWQVWSKPLPKGQLAVLVIAIAETPQSVSVPLSTLGLSGSVASFDLYTKQQATVSGSLDVAGLAPHDSRFVILNYQA